MEKEFLNTANICVYADKKIYKVPVEYAYDGYFLYRYSEHKLRQTLILKESNKLYELDLLEILFDWQCVISFFEFVEMNDNNLFLQTDFNN